MKFCCVTPCLNAAAHIRTTVRSVLSQSLLHSNRCSLHYIIKDAGSTDNTINEVQGLLAEFADRDNITVQWISEKDRGMYDAIATAFRRLPGGDVYCYINAGDYYSPHAFEIVAEIFSGNGVSFLTGLNCWYNESNHFIGCMMPYRYDKNLLRKGFYAGFLPFIQQESTFWSRELQERIDVDRLSEIKLAGDHFLWLTFIERAPLFVVNAWLGGFKIQKGQLSQRFFRQYVDEMRDLSERRSIRDYVSAYVQKFLWRLPDETKRRLSNHIFSYNNNARRYELTRHRH